MRYISAFLATVLLAATAQAQAACTGSVAASGLNLVVGTPQSFTVRSAAPGCVPQGAIYSISGTGDGSIYNAAIGGGGGLTVTGLAAGAGTMVISGSGFTPLTVPVTVTMGTFDITQP